MVGQTLRGDGSSSSGPSCPEPAWELLWLGERVTQSPSTARVGLGLFWPCQEKPKAKGVFVQAVVAGLTMQVFPQH